MHPSTAIFIAPETGAGGRTLDGAPERVAGGRGAGTPGWSAEYPAAEEGVGVAGVPGWSAEYPAAAKGELRAGGSKVDAAPGSRSPSTVFHSTGWWLWGADDAAAALLLVLEVMSMGALAPS